MVVVTVAVVRWPHSLAPPTREDAPLNEDLIKSSPTGEDAPLPARPIRPLLAAWRPINEDLIQT